MEQQKKHRQYNCGKYNIATIITLVQELIIKIEERLKLVRWSAHPYLQ